MNRLKTDIVKIKEEAAEAIRREISAEVIKNQQIEECRNKYDEAKEEMRTALSAGNIDLYKTAGMKAEEARLELEFFEKSLASERKPAASKDDDLRFCIAIKNEVNVIRLELINQLEELFLKALKICTDAHNRVRAIGDLTNSWDKYVMKVNGRDYTTNAFISIGSLSNEVNGQIQRLKNMKGV